MKNKIFLRITRLSEYDENIGGTLIKIRTLVNMLERKQNLTVMLLHKLFFVCGDAFQWRFYQQVHRPL